MASMRSWVLPSTAMSPAPSVARLIRWFPTSTPLAELSSMMSMVVPTRTRAWSFDTFGSHSRTSALGERPILEAPIRSGTSSPVSGPSNTRSTAPTVSLPAWFSGSGTTRIMLPECTPDSATAASGDSTATCPRGSWTCRVGRGPEVSSGSDNPSLRMAVATSVAVAVASAVMSTLWKESPLLRVTRSCISPPSSCGFVLPQCPIRAGARWSRGGMTPPSPRGWRDDCWPRTPPRRAAPSLRPCRACRTRC